MSAPEAAVEAAAKALLLMLGPRSVTLEDLNTEDKAEELAAARRVLEAAAPFMLADAWDEGYTAADYDAPHSIKSPNPYRA